LNLNEWFSPESIIDFISSPLIGIAPLTAY
jgi:hypothetical protein